MPPGDEPQPTAEERRLLTEWIDEAIAMAGEGMHWYMSLLRGQTPYWQNIFEKGREDIFAKVDSYKYMSRKAPEALQFGADLNATIRWLIRIGNILIVGLVMTALFRMAAASRHITLVRAAPGAFALAVMWQFLQYLGTLYVSSVLTNASSVNATFALVPV